MFKLVVLVFAACLALSSAILTPYHGAYSLYNGGVTYGIGSFGGHGIHGHLGYRGFLPYGHLGLIG